MEVTIKIDKRSKQAKALFEYLKSLPYVKVEEREPNETTKRAMRDIENGKDKPISLDRLLKQLD